MGPLSKDEDDEVKDEKTIQFNSDGDDDETEKNNGPKSRKSKKASGGPFGALGLKPETCQAVHRMGFNLPTPIQRRAIPAIMSRSGDVIAVARTGSGKTCMFAIPILERLKTHSLVVGARGLILSPTRELALQTGSVCLKLMRGFGMRICLLVGGNSLETQFARLAENPDILICSPGRLVQHMTEVKLSLKMVEIAIFDEADKLFELAFETQMDQIVNSMTNPDRQLVATSATISPQLANFTKYRFRNLQVVRLDAECTLSEDLSLNFFCCRAEDKVPALLYWLRSVLDEADSVIIFCATRHHVEFISLVLTYSHVPNVHIFGSMDQYSRNEALGKVRNGSIKVMVVTDLAARGINIPELDHVFHFDFPCSAKLFVHRSGRTARAGRSGTATALVTAEDLPYLMEISLTAGLKFAAPAPRDSPDGTLRDSAVLNDDEVMRKNKDENKEKLADASTDPNCNVMIQSAEEGLGLSSTQNSSRGEIPLGGFPDLTVYRSSFASILEDRCELIRIKMSMDKGTILYRKSRTPASKSSLKRAREVYPSDKFLDLVDSVHCELRGRVGRLKPYAKLLRDNLYREKTGKVVDPDADLDRIFGVHRLANREELKKEIDENNKTIKSNYVMSPEQCRSSFRASLADGGEKGLSLSPDVLAGVKKSTAIRRLPSILEAHQRQVDKLKSRNEGDEEIQNAEDDNSDEDDDEFDVEAEVKEEIQHAGLISSAPKISVAERKFLKRKKSTVMSPELKSEFERLKLQKYSDCTPAPQFVLSEANESIRDELADDPTSVVGSFLNKKKTAKGTIQADANVLNDMTLHLGPDENDLMSKTQHVSRWDQKKKKYIVVPIDKSGKIMKTKNESGVTVSGEFQSTGAYKKWAANAKVRIQTAGEEEDVNMSKRKNKMINEIDYNEDGANRKVPLSKLTNDLALVEAVQTGTKLTRKQRNKLDRILKRRDNPVSDWTNGVPIKSKNKFEKSDGTLKTAMELKKDKKDAFKKKMSQDKSFRKKTKEVKKGINFKKLQKQGLVSIVQGNKSRKGKK